MNKFRDYIKEDLSDKEIDIFFEKEDLKKIFTTLVKKAKEQSEFPPRVKAWSDFYKKISDILALIDKETLTFKI